MLPWFLNPKTALRELESIDRDPPSHCGDRRMGSRQSLIILASVCIALLLLHYLKNSQSLTEVLHYISRWQGRPGYWVQALNQSSWNGLLRYLWWTSWHVITFVAIPALVIKFYLKGRVRDYGWRWGETHLHWRGYLLLLSPILVFVVMASFRDDFVHHYPFYRDAGRSWIDLIAWQLLYLTQFACLEFFFRGYLVQALRPYYGAGAIYIMIVPYLMIHFPKPWLEATGAIFFGLFLGMLALRSRSIWGGFLVHAGVAVSMDIAALIQQGRIPQTWWPTF